MKKIINALFIGAAALVMLTGCGGDKTTTSTDVISAEDSAKIVVETIPAETNTEKSSHPDVKGIDKKLVGVWKDFEVGMGFEFCENGSLGVTMDYTDYMHFNEKMEFCGQGFKAVPVEYDGKTIQVYAEPSEEGEEAVLVIKLDRIEGSVPDSLDGEFKLSGGLLYSEFAEQFGPEQTIKLDIEGEELWMHVMSGQYAADGKGIFMENGIFFSRGGVYGEYTINGDDLTLDVDGEISKLVKAK